jgi:CDP-diacylglycerol--glycerol-3-phosphate 3-phosphatidyltransferase/cardiolipin synthase
LLSLARVPLAALFPFVVHRSALAIAVLLAGGMSDALDGFWARRSGQVTATGAMLDPITDKIFILTVAITLLATGRLTVLELLLLGARELLELPLVLWRAVARRQNGPAPTLSAGKAVTWLQFLATGAVVLRFHASAWIGVTSLAGASVALAYWRRELRQARAASPQP